MLNTNNLTIQSSLNLWLKGEGIIVYFQIASLNRHVQAFQLNALNGYMYLGGT